MAGHRDDPITRLIQAHVASELRSYQGDLAYAAHVVGNQWLPAEDDPDVQQHLETLRRHMAGIGHPERDGFLLRLGLTVPGTQRGILPPLMVLGANRGGFSARRQREVEGQILRLREALAIGRRFVPDLSSDTQQALAELLDLSQVRQRPDDVDWLRWFGKLSSDEAGELAVRAIGYVDSGEKTVHEIGTQILQNLACFRDSPLDEASCLALIERDVFWPSSLYRDSGEAVAAELISRIYEAAELLALNHLLLALAWTRSAAAQQAFRRWSTQPPAWASKLHVPPSAYLPHAGWCLDEGGEARALISTSCFRLLAGSDASSRSIRCCTRLGEPCPSCGGPLSLLFDFSRIDATYFPGELAEAPRKVLCCLHCSCWETVYTAYRADGTAEWLSPFEVCRFPNSGHQQPCIHNLDESPCPPFACAEPFALDDASTLGGIPMWLQDAEYPRCIQCRRGMTFLAQHDNGHLGNEGIYYAFFCAPCHVAAVNYQQT